MYILYICIYYISIPSCINISEPNPNSCLNANSRAGDVICNVQLCNTTPLINQSTFPQELASNRKLIPNQHFLLNWQLSLQKPPSNESFLTDIHTYRLLLLSSFFSPCLFASFLLIPSVDLCLPWI